MKHISYVLLVLLAMFSLNAMAETKIAFIDGARILEKYEPVIDAKLHKGKHNNKIPMLF